MPETFEDVIKREVAAIRETVEDLSEDIHGSKRFKGILVRLDTVESLAEVMRKEREAMNNKLRGILIGLGLTGVTTTGLLAAVIRIITGGA